MFPLITIEATTLEDAVTISQGAAERMITPVKLEITRMEGKKLPSSLEISTKIFEVVTFVNRRIFITVEELKRLSGRQKFTAALRLEIESQLIQVGCKVSLGQKNTLVVEMPDTVTISYTNALILMHMKQQDK